MTILDHALDAASKNWHVFPLLPNSKEPAVKWKDQNTADGLMIRQWTWQRISGYGIACGPSNLVVIDIDEPKDDEIDPMFGFPSWCRLLAESGLKTEPMTYEVVTPSGGIHLYYSANPSLTVSNSASKLAPGIDVRANGGFVVGAGSKTDKGIYEVTRNISPTPLPHWLRGLLTRSRAATSFAATQRRNTPGTPASPIHGHKYASAALLNELDAVRKAPSGQGNDQLNRSAFAIKRFIENGTFAGADIAQQFLNVAMQRGRSEGEAMKTITSALGENYF